MMVEGMSLRAIARLTGASKNTIVKFLRDAGEACLRYQDEHLRNLPCKRIQVDEVWSFIHAKQSNLAAAKGRPGERWRHLDVDSDLRRYQAGAVLAGRRSGYRTAR
jgi:hypothetical protein